MAIIVGSRAATHGLSGLVGYQEALDPGRRQERVIRALVKAGMSEETALEQIVRLAAGDIWCG